MHDAMSGRPSRTDICITQCRVAMRGPTFASRKCRSGGGDPTLRHANVGPRGATRDLCLQMSVRGGRPDIYVPECRFMYGGPTLPKTKMSGQGQTVFSKLFANYCLAATNLQRSKPTASTVFTLDWHCCFRQCRFALTGPTSLSRRCRVAMPAPTFWDVNVGSPNMTRHLHDAMSGRYARTDIWGRKCRFVPPDPTFA